MAVEIKIPKLGLTMTEAELTDWSVAAGRQVEEGEIVCVIDVRPAKTESVDRGAGRGAVVPRRRNRQPHVCGRGDRVPCRR